MIICSSNSFRSSAASARVLHKRSPVAGLQSAFAYRGGGTVIGYVPHYLHSAGDDDVTPQRYLYIYFSMVASHMFYILCPLLFIICTCSHMYLHQPHHCHHYHCTMQVTAAASDTQLRRSRHRLSLLATACIHECLTVTNIGRVRARDIVQVTHDRTRTHPATHTHTHTHISRLTDSWC